MFSPKYRLFIPPESFPDDPYIHILMQGREDIELLKTQKRKISCSVRYTVRDSRIGFLAGLKAADKSTKKKGIVLV